MAAVWVGVALAAVASILLAPVVTVGWCADADETGTSVCGSAQRSVLGIDTNVWAWIGALGLIAVATLVIAKSTPGRR